MRRLRKLVAFLARERRLVDERRPAVGLRRATAARVRAHLELDAVQSIPDMGRALEGLAARIAALEGRAPDPAPAAAAAAPAAAPRRRRWEPAPPPPSGIPLANVRPRPRDADEPLRVLGVNDMFPLATETYVYDEVASLRPHGAQIAWYRRFRGPSPTPVPEPVFEDFDEAMARFDPSVGIVHWLTTAGVALPLFERHGLPFGIRTHSFDFDRLQLAQLLAHPLCVGAWTYSSPDYRFDGAHTLDPVFTSVDLLPEPPARRDKVISISAGLPKKDWPLLLDAFERMDARDRRLVIGVTGDHEDCPSELVNECMDREDPPLVQVNLDRAQALRLISESAVLIYTLQPHIRFGMPMSLVEGLCAGCSVVVPDRPEALAYAGAYARPYRTADDIARHVHEVLAGGEAIAAEQEANRAYGRARFCDPQAGAGFHQELLEGLSTCYARANSHSVSR